MRRMARRLRPAGAVMATLALAACSAAPGTVTQSTRDSTPTLLRLPAPSVRPASPQQAWAEAQRLMKADLYSHEGHNLAFYAAENGVMEAAAQADEIFDPFHYRTTEPPPPAKAQTEQYQNWVDSAEASVLFYLRQAADRGAARARLGLAYAANPFRVSSSETNFFYVPRDRDCIRPPGPESWSKDWRLHFTHGYFAQVVAPEAAGNASLLRQCLTRAASWLAASEQAAGDDRRMRAQIAYLKAQILLILTNRFPNLVYDRPQPPVHDGPGILAAVFHLDVNTAERQGRELLREAAGFAVGFASSQLGKIDPGYAQTLAAGSSAYQEKTAADLASGQASSAEGGELGMVIIRTLQRTKLPPAEEQERFRSGLTLVQAAAQKGDTRAMLFLADLHAEGRMGWHGPLLEKDSRKAAEWANKALAATDIDTINQYPPARQRMEAVARVEAEKTAAERQRQEAARRREAEQEAARQAAAQAQRRLDDEHNQALKLLEQ